MGVDFQETFTASGYIVWCEGARFQTCRCLCICLSDIYGGWGVFKAHMIVYIP